MSTLPDFEPLPFALESPKLTANAEGVYTPERRVGNEHINTFYTLAECEEHLLSLLKNKPPQGAKELRIFDPNLQVFSSKMMVEALHEFFLGSRTHRMVAVLLDDQVMRRDFHRLMNELKTFAHVCNIYVLQRMRETIEDAFVIADSRHLLLRPNHDQMVGTFYFNQKDLIIPYRERFEDLLEASERVGLYTLGL